MIPELEINPIESCDNCIFLYDLECDCRNQELSGFGCDPDYIRGVDSNGDFKGYTPCGYHIETSKGIEILNWFIQNRHRIVEVEE